MEQSFSLFALILVALFLIIETSVSEAVGLTLSSIMLLGFAIFFSLNGIKHEKLKLSPILLLLIVATAFADLSAILYIFSIVRMTF